VDELRIVCEAHGDRTAHAVCAHHLDGAGKGWHMLGSGDDSRPDAICFECVDVWDPDMSAEEAGVEPVMVCSGCYDEIRERHDIARD
jgi:hypothetical protein